MRTIPVTFIVAVAMLLPAFAQSRLRVLISVDMEGVSEDLLI